MAQKMVNPEAEIGNLIRKKDEISKVMESIPTKTKLIETTQLGRTAVTKTVVEDLTRNKVIPEGLEMMALTLLVKQQRDKIDKMLESKNV
jgi:hypothetical protein